MQHTPEVFFLRVTGQNLAACYSVGANAVQVGKAYFSACLPTQLNPAEACIGGEGGVTKEVASSL